MINLRPYQNECIERAKQKNTIVCLPTGTGKTLIAVKLIDYYLAHYPNKLVAFLVPTRALVEQQARYCETHCDTPVVVERVFGEEQANWTYRDWQDAVQRSNIVLGTAAIFQKVFTTERHLALEDVSLLIFDECHNCVGNSPMSAVMHDAVAPYYDQVFHHSVKSSSMSAVLHDTVAPYYDKTSTLPRILGLTASFVNGSLMNLPKKRQALEERLLSTIICPTLSSRLGSENFTRVTWIRSRQELLRQQEAAIDRYVREAVTAVARVKDISKVISKCTHVFRALGWEALQYYVQDGIVSQIQAKISSLERTEEEHPMRAAARMRSNLPMLQASLDVLWQNLEADTLLSRNNNVPSDANRKSAKLVRLLELLNEICSGSSTMRGIIFVEQIALVSSLRFQVNEYFEKYSQVFIRAGAVAGVGAQTENERQKHLNSFRSSGKNNINRVLVATAALEEGIDVPDCSFVIRFDPVATTKAHIQGSGRVRRTSNSNNSNHVYYFENDPDSELRKEGFVASVARDASLELSASKLQNSCSRMNMCIEDRHPYPFHSTLNAASATGPVLEITGIVNVYNCKQIFNHYCSFALGRSISPLKLLYRYLSAFSMESGQSIPLKSIRYPTPSGWKIKSREEYKSFWSGIDTTTVFTEQRASSSKKKKTAKDWEEMMFVYLVVVELREQRLLDRYNRPPSSSTLPNFRFDIVRNCPILPNENNNGIGISLKNNKLF